MIKADIIRSTGVATACINEYHSFVQNNKTDGSLLKFPFAADTYEYTVNVAGTETSHTFDRDEVYYCQCGGQLTSEENLTKERIEQVMEDITVPVKTSPEIKGKILGQFWNIDTEYPAVSSSQSFLQGDWSRCQHSRGSLSSLAVNNIHVTPSDGHRIQFTSDFSLDSWPFW
ncbi:hypothetical protein ARMGADRAFT_1031361 [Armillaria gallica]|uniref:Uncharacterized protein n=1 Tax=Armillaria gallica TaxID=47427 RepID=A0A2H3D9J2_ARMGA|nr:hypothetical protein ARMGADRAFT_1031361 [Armillaria gallica]